MIEIILAFGALYLVFNTNKEKPRKANSKKTSK